MKIPKFKSLINIITKLNTIMANLQDLKNKLIEVKEAVNALNASVTAGVILSPEDTDSLLADLQAIEDVVNSTLNTTTTSTTIV